MNVVSWNIQWGLGLDGRVDLARIVRHLRDLADPDVICLQEVADNMPDLPGQGGADQFAALAALLPEYRMVPAPAVEITDGAGGSRRFGNAMLSRLPVRQVIRHALPWPGAPEGPSMARGLLEVALLAPFGPVRVMTTHLEYSSPELRGRAVAAIRAIHADSCSREARPREAGPGPYAVEPGSASAILTGDFNMPPDDPVRLALLAPSAPDGPDVPPLEDAWTLLNGTAPHPPSFCIADATYGLPRCTDFVLVTADLAARVERVTYDTLTRLSDHQPVVLTLADPG